jgi:hypothetical protein
MVERQDTHLVPMGRQAQGFNPAMVRDGQNARPGMLAEAGATVMLNVRLRVPLAAFSVSTTKL